MAGRYPVDPFDRVADSYDASVLSSVGWPHEGYEEVLNEVVTRADTHPHMTVLDLGVGTGNLAQRFLAIGCSVWGMDFSASMLAQAKAKLPGATLVHGDLVEAWPREVQRRFDRVVSSYVLHHFDLNTKRELLLRVFSSHLEDAGRIVVADNSFPTAGAREQARGALSEVWEEEEHYWAADETRDLFKQAGVQTEYVQVSRFGGVYVFRPA